MRGTMVRNPAPPSSALASRPRFERSATQKKRRHTGFADPRPPHDPRRYRGCNPDLRGAECQTCGISNLASDWASPDLYPVVLPPFAAGGWALFLTLYLSSAGRFKGRFLALDLTTRTLSLLARLVGATVASASVWASHGAWVDGMELCQRGVHAPIRLRTQHAGWYVGILANGLAFLSGAFAVFFGRGNVLGPTNQLAMASIDERQFDAITPRGRGVLGRLDPGRAGYANAEARDTSEAHRANAGAFTRRDVDDEEIAMTAREYGVGTGGVWGGDARRGGRRRRSFRAGEKTGGVRRRRRAEEARRAAPASRRRPTANGAGRSSRRGSGGRKPRTPPRLSRDRRMVEVEGPTRGTRGTWRNGTSGWAGSGTSSGGSRRRGDVPGVPMRVPTEAGTTRRRGRIGATIPRRRRGRPCRKASRV